MRIHYYRNELNFGDDLNRWLWEELLPGYWSPDDGINFSGIGTIFNADVMPAAKKWVVFTSGIGYGAPPAEAERASWHILAVRGPLSAAVLRLPSDASATDGAILLAALPRYAPVPAYERSGVVFVPHHRIEDVGDWQNVCQRAGIEYVSPKQDSRKVIERLRTAKLVLADAMHAAIIADTMRVPWIPIVSSPQISTFKWLDWTASMSVPYAPVQLPPSTMRSELRNAMLWAYNQAHLFKTDGQQQALAYFEMRYAKPPSHARRLAMRAGRYLHRSAEAALQASLFAKRREARDAALLDRTAGVLAAAALSDGFLSSDKTFRDRLDTLHSRLSGIRTLAEATE